MDSAGKPTGTGCSATANLLENTPGYAANDFDLYGKVKLEFDKLNYGTYSNAPYAFNPWVQFIHGDAILPDQLGMPGVYAYSVDDAVGNLNVEAQGYIVDIGSTKHLENQTRAQPPINISFGYASTDAGQVCDLWRLRQRPVAAKTGQSRQSPNLSSARPDPKNCPVYFTDNKSPAQIYTFTVTTAPPFTIIPTADVKKNLASWSSGGGNPTKYNTTGVIDCSGNNGVAPSQSSKAWCCTLLPGSTEPAYSPTPRRKFRPPPTRV